MKEVIKNKAMIGFILFMVMISYVNSIQMKEVMDTEVKTENQIALNQK